MTSDDAWTALGQVNQWIRFADAKATALLASSGVLGGLLVSTPPSVEDDAGVRIAFFVVAVCAVALSAFVSLQALLPRLWIRQSPNSLLYFDHIARQYATDAEGYILAFAEVAGDTKAMNQEIASQIWTNSLVARLKFRRVTSATWLIGFALLSTGVAVLLERMR